MKIEKKYLINEDLVEMPSTALLQARTGDQAKFERAVSRVISRDVPMVSTDGIIAGLRYKSSVDGQSDFYLPRYVVRSMQGRRTTRLEMFPPSDDPTAPAGRLTVELQALPLVTVDPVRIMPHDVSLRLGYHVPVSSDAPSETPFGLARFEGRWRNSDPDTDGVTTLKIAVAGENQLKLHATRDQHANKTDLGTVVADIRDGHAMASFHIQGSSVTLTLSERDGMLSVSELLDVHDPDAPGDRVIHHVFHPDHATGDTPFIWMDLAPVSDVGSTVRKSVTTIEDMETYIRLYRVLTRPEHRARIEVTATATVGRRSVKQNFVGHKARKALLERVGAKAFHIDPAAAKKIREKALSTVIEQPEAAVQPNIEMRIERTPQANTRPATPRVAPDSTRRIDTIRLPVADTLDQPSVLRRSIPTRFGRNAELVRRIAESRRLAEEAGRTSSEGRHRADVQTLSVALNKSFRDKIVTSKLPSWVMVEPSGKPVLTRRQETGVQIVSPFWADPDLHADLLDAPEDSSGGLVLLRHEIRSGSDTAIFYQDGLVPSQIYYEPQEFRLVRSESAPYAPLVLFHLNEEVDESAASDDGPSYSVTMTYQAKPYIQPDLIAAAHEQFGADSRISPITPTVTSLTIGLLADNGDTEAEVTRDDADVDFVHGLSDALTFDEDEYRQLTTAFQTASGIGLSGHVAATFPDGRQGTVPVRIGMRNTIGDVFNASLTNAEDSPSTTVTYVNRIESPTRIHEFPVVILGEDRRAIAETAPPTDPLAPGGTLAVTYRSDPPGGTLTVPPQLSNVSVLPDLLAILAQTTVVQGYANDTFEVTVRIEPMFFDFTPEGAEPLTGVSVTFRTREEPVVLTPDAPSQTVTLQMPHILFLTNATEAQHYAYSVQDLHASGAGAATPYAAGSGNLDVQPAMSQSGGG